MPPHATFASNQSYTKDTANNRLSSMKQKSTKRQRSSSCCERLSVSFNTKVTVRNTIHINNYSEEELSATWFSTNEFNAMKSEMKSTLKKMKRNGGKSIPINDEDVVGLSSRGLESLTPDGIAKKRIVRQNAIDAVLDEQYLQYREDDYDPEFNADSYSKKCRRSKAQARAKGRSDAVWVKLQNIQPFQKYSFYQLHDATFLLPTRGLTKQRSFSSAAA